MNISRERLSNCANPPRYFSRSAVVVAALMTILLPTISCSVDRTILGGAASDSATLEWMGIAHLRHVSLDKVASGSAIDAYARVRISGTQSDVDAVLEDSNLTMELSDALYGVQYRALASDAEVAELRNSRSGQQAWDPRISRPTHGHWAYRELLRGEDESGSAVAYIAAYTT